MQTETIHSIVVGTNGILVRIKEMADMLIPLHEPRFAGVDRIG